MALLQLDEFKTKQRATWEGGDYSSCSPWVRYEQERHDASVTSEPGIACEPPGSVA